MARAASRRRRLARLRTTAPPTLRVAVKPTPIVAIAVGAVQPLDHHGAAGL